MHRGGVHGFGMPGGCAVILSLQTSSKGDVMIGAPGKLLSIRDAAMGVQDQVRAPADAPGRSREHVSWRTRVPAFSLLSQVGGLYHMIL